MYTIRQNSRINHVDGLTGKCAAMSRSKSLADGNTYETLAEVYEYLGVSARNYCRTCWVNLALEEAAEQAHAERVADSMAPSTGEGDYLPPAEPTGSVKVTESCITAQVVLNTERTAVAVATEGHNFIEYPQLYLARRPDGTWYGVDDYDDREPITVDGPTIRGTVRSWLRMLAEFGGPDTDTEHAAALAQARGCVSVTVTEVRSPSAPAAADRANPTALADAVLAVVDQGLADFHRADTTLDAEQVAARTLEAVRKLVAPGPDTKVSVELFNEHVGEARCGDAVVTLANANGVWRAVGSGVAGCDLQDVMRAWAVSLGHMGPVTVTVKPPL